MDAINPTMNRQFLSTTPCILDDRRLADIGDRLDDIQFAQPVIPDVYKRQAYVSAVKDGSFPAQEHCF